MQCQLAEEIRVIHTFQKKLPRGTKTPKREMDLIRDRLKETEGDGCNEIRQAGADDEPQ